MSNELLIKSKHVSLCLITMCMVGLGYVGVILCGSNCEIKPKQVTSFMLGWVRSVYVVLGFWLCWWF